MVDDDVWAKLNYGSVGGSMQLERHAVDWRQMLDDCLVSERNR